MDIERPHRTSSTPSTTSELFICFTSRLSKSSSMRLSSKSILSPSRASDKHNHSLSLSTSLSHRLRQNGSLRGAQSPAMFPFSKKNNKGSSGFGDNPEPSSPKVTCIGQVRVKTKKQGKRMKMRACRSKRLSGGGGSGGEASFRRIEHSNSHEVLQNQQAQECGLNNHRNQRWVHLPITICEALRTFGSEFSCLFPCKSSCFSSEKTGENRVGGGGEHHSDGGANSCAVFRWLVSLQEGEGEGKRRDIELVVGGEEEEVERGVVMERECSRRRSIFDDMEFDDLFSNVKNGGDERSEIFWGNVDDDVVEEGERRRVSLCIPPKNALLLMRCRSDPMKMASLSRKLWEVEVPLPQNDDDNDGDVEEMAGVVKVVESEVELHEKTEEIGDVKAEEKRDVITEEIGDVKAEEKRDVKTEENRDVKTEEIGDDETEIIGEEITEEIGEEETVEIGEEIEVLDEGSEEVDQIEDLPGFSEEEQRETEEDEQETEEEQSIENRGISKEEECEVFEETQLIKDEIDAIECSIKTITEEEKVEECEIEQDWVKISEENPEEKMEESVEFVESNDLSTVDEVDEKARCESSEISTTSSSSLNSSDESTAESREREEDQEQLEKDPVEVVEEQLRVQEEERKSMEEKPKPSLPDCLLLMMCEPKVSVEVSKETWVCSTDFIRWLPERHPKKMVTKTEGSDESTTKKTKPMAVAAIPPHWVQQRFEQSAQPPLQPGRSSISFPAGGGTVANLIEQKLVKAGGYEPFMLTRCKSAPMRSAGKLEPHRPGTFGVGAAGVGF